jgi:hypothetical protein
MARKNTIRLRWPAYCDEPTCGAYLPPGSLARYYGRNGVYGVNCHTRSEMAPPEERVRGKAPSSEQEGRA